MFSNHYDNFDEVFDNTSNTFNNDDLFVTSAFSLVCPASQQQETEHQQQFFSGSYSQLHFQPQTQQPVMYNTLFNNPEEEEAFLSSNAIDIKRTAKNI